MKLRTVSPQWFNEDRDKTAKCTLFPANANYDPWFDDDEEDSHTEDAKAICNGTFDGRECPLKAVCLEFAMTNNERYGVWGGMTADERAKLRKERKWQRSGASSKVA